MINIFLRFISVGHEGAYQCCVIFNDNIVCYLAHFGFLLQAMKFSLLFFMWLFFRRYNKLTDGYPPLSFWADPASDIAESAFFFIRCIQYFFQILKKEIVWKFIIRPQEEIPGQFFEHYKLLFWKKDIVKVNKSV